MSATWRRWSPVILILLSVLAYANAFRGPFLFDDNNAITDNRFIRHLWPPEYLFRAPPQSTVAGRPLVGLTLAVNYAISGLQPWSYHAGNLILHGACALLLLGILSRTLKRDGLAFAMAAIWAVHPLLTESVTYTIQRTELLMAFFFLLTLYSVIRGWRLVAVAACAAGMASKEVIVVAPVLIFLFDRTFLAGSFREAWRQRGSLYVGLAGTWVVLAMILLSSPRGESVGLNHADVTPWQYALTQSGVILHYLRLGIWPSPLVADYDDWPIAKSVMDVWPALVCIGVLLGLTVWALRFRPKLGFLGAWFFLILAPTSSVVPIITEVAAERRLYLPLMAVVVLVVGGVERLRFLTLTTRRWAVGASLAGLTLLTSLRNRDYASEVDFWRDAVFKRPQNVRALVNLAAATMVEGRPEEASAWYQRALTINPDNAEAHYNIGIILALDNRHLKEALPHLQRSVELSPKSSLAQYNLGIVLAQLGRLPEAEVVLRTALLLEPDSGSAHKELGVVLAKQKKLREALPHFEEAVRLRPQDTDAWRMLDVTQRQLEMRRTNAPSGSLRQG